jgi:predicted branched-subunit amino acid permease
LTFHPETTVDPSALHAVSPSLPPRQEFLAGVRDQLPFIAAGIPFGVLYGAAAIEAGLPPAAAQGLSLLVFAGSAQFLTIGLFANGVPWLVIVLTIAVVNLRHALYSASLAPYYARLPSLWKAVLSWLLTDEAFATTAVRYRGGWGSTTHWYALGAGLGEWSAWQASTAAGVLLGSRLPESEVLGFIVPLTFLALLFPSVTGRRTAVAALVGGVVSVLLADLPFGLGLLAASCAGIVAGVVTPSASTQHRRRAT